MDCHSFFGDHSMNAEQIRSLQRVLDYLAQDEQSHFESASPEERTNHIYLDVLILQECLEQQKGEPNS
jgi:hypothetical protein